jgi:hypothetical protein
MPTEQLRWVLLARANKNMLSVTNLWCDTSGAHQQVRGWAYFFKSSHCSSSSAHSSATPVSSVAHKTTPNSSNSKTFEFGFDSIDPWAWSELPSASFTCVHHIHSLHSTRLSYPFILSFIVRPKKKPRSYNYSNCHLTPLTLRTSWSLIFTLILWELKWAPSIRGMKTIIAQHQSWPHLSNAATKHTLVTMIVLPLIAKT